MPYCFKVFLAEKFLSSNVQILFRKKLEVIDKIIAIVEACNYQKFDIVALVNIIDSILFNIMYTRTCKRKIARIGIPNITQLQSMYCNLRCHLAQQSSLIRPSPYRSPSYISRCNHYAVTIT